MVVSEVLAAETVMSLPVPYYEHDGITIYHGDCREILSKLHFTAMLTDPPYNVSLGSQQHGTNRKKEYVSHYDSLGIGDYQHLIDAITKYAITVPSLITCGNSNQAYWPIPKWTMAWTKLNGITRTPLTRGQKMNHSCWEPILVYGKLEYPPRSDVFNVSISVQADVDGHPCPKPLKLWTKLVSCFADDAIILDPFMGSGTTLRAAKDLRRKAIGIEIEEKYCEIAANRLSQEVLDFT